MKGYRKIMKSDDLDEIQEWLDKVIEQKALSQADKKQAQNVWLRQYLVAWKKMGKEGRLTASKKGEGRALSF